MGGAKIQDTRCPITGAPTENPNGSGYKSNSTRHKHDDPHAWGSSLVQLHGIVINDARVIQDNP